MPVRKLKEFLTTHDVPYESITHAQTFTAGETAQAAHVKGREMAKVVLVKCDGKMCMAVVPAHYHVDLDRLKEITGAQSIQLAEEKEFEALFPECDIGAMPPFGNLYGMDVFVEQELAEDEAIAFNAGTHTEVIKMAYGDFERLVKPNLGSFAS